MVPARFCPIDEIKFRHFDWRTKKRYQGWATKEIRIGELKHRFKAYYGCRVKTWRVFRASIPLEYIGLRQAWYWCPFWKSGLYHNQQFHQKTSMQIIDNTRSEPKKARLALRGVLKTTIGLWPSSKSRNLCGQFGQTWQIIIIAMFALIIIGWGLQSQKKRKLSG